jgi:hypothetical protein
LLKLFEGEALRALLVGVSHDFQSWKRASIAAEVG